MQEGEVGRKDIQPLPTIQACLSRQESDTSRDKTTKRSSTDQLPSRSTGMVTHPATAIEAEKMAILVARSAGLYL